MNSFSVSIPPPPATQCLASDTFKQPPLDGSMAVPEIYDWHLRNSPNHPLFVYDDDGAERVIDWATAVRAVHRAGRVIQSRVKCTDLRMPVVAILASSGKFFLRVSQLLNNNVHKSRHNILFHCHRRHYACGLFCISHLHSKFPCCCRSPASKGESSACSGWSRARSPGSHFQFIVFDRRRSKANHLRDAIL